MPSPRKKSSTSSRNRSRTSSYSECRYGTSDKELNGRCEGLLGSDTLRRMLEEDRSRLQCDVDEMPPFECFNSEIRSTDAKRKLVEDINIGDELCVRVKRVELAGMYVQPLCVLRPLRRSLNWIENFQVLMGREMEEGVRDLRPNDLLKVVVDQPEHDGQPFNLRIDHSAELLSHTDLPAYFRNGDSLKEGTTFEEFLSTHDRTDNPNLSDLYDIGVNATISFLPELKDANFSSKTRAPNLRRKQDEELSMQSALKGVEKIRSGESQVAIQHFNKALSLFENNIEALVGRAAASANLGDFVKAEQDLDTALSLNLAHTNAKAYMIETLLQAAKKLEEEDKVDEARLKYEKILVFKDDERARERLRYLQRSPSVEEIDDPKNGRRLSDAEKREREKMETNRRAKERRERRKTAEKLAEMEKFIQQLKKNEK